jgi:hypothetical protein
MLFEWKKQPPTFEKEGTREEDYPFLEAFEGPLDLLLIKHS